MPASVFTIVLDYCGGEGTDRLVESLAAWNPTRAVNVLDNASPRLRSRYVTQQNHTNRNVGGGIQDCIALAERSGASHALIIMNDVKFCTPMFIGAFEAALAIPNRPVHVSASMSRVSSQAQIFPWTATAASRGVRDVQHADILCSLIDVDFVKGFGGFPPSETGWGYGWELAYHANLQGRPICVLDECVIHHSRELRTKGEIEKRRAEMRAGYTAKYGEVPWLSFRSEIEARYASQGSVRNE